MWDNGYPWFLKYKKDALRKQWLLIVCNTVTGANMAVSFLWTNALIETEMKVELATGGTDSTCAQGCILLYYSNDGGLEKHEAWKLAKWPMFIFTGMQAFKLMCMVVSPARVRNSKKRGCIFSSVCQGCQNCSLPLYLSYYILPAIGFLPSAQLIISVGAPSPPGSIISIKIKILMCSVSELLWRALMERLDIALSVSAFSCWMGALRLPGVDGTWCLLGILLWFILRFECWQGNWLLGIISFYVSTLNKKQMDVVPIMSNNSNPEMDPTKRKAKKMYIHRKTA